MFSLATIYTAMLTLDSLSVSYIDRREYPTGPWGYQYYDGSKAIVVAPEFLTLLNQWLADGLLVSAGANSVKQVFNIGHPSSCIAAVLFMP